MTLHSLSPNINDEVNVVFVQQTSSDDYQTINSVTFCFVVMLQKYALFFVSDLSILDTLPDHRVALSLGLTSIVPIVSTFGICLDRYCRSH